jgi:hypothetical protein
MDWIKKSRRVPSETFFDAGLGVVALLTKAIMEFITAAIIQIRSLTSKKAKTSEKKPRLMYPIHPDRSLHHV